MYRNMQSCRISRELHMQKHLTCHCTHNKHMLEGSLCWAALKCKWQIYIYYLGEKCRSIFLLYCFYAKPWILEPSQHLQPPHTFLCLFSIHPWRIILSPLCDAFHCARFLFLTNSNCLDKPGNCCLATAWLKKKKKITYHISRGEGIRASNQMGLERKRTQHGQRTHDWERSTRLWEAV